MWSKYWFMLAWWNNPFAGSLLEPLCRQAEGMPWSSHQLYSLLWGLCSILLRVGASERFLVLLNNAFPFAPVVTSGLGHPLVSPDLSSRQRRRASKARWSNLPLPQTEALAFGGFSLRECVGCFRGESLNFIITILLERRCQLESHSYFIQFTELMVLQYLCFPHGRTNVVASSYLGTEGLNLAARNATAGNERSENKNKIRLELPVPPWLRFYYPIDSSQPLSSPVHEWKITGQEEVLGPVHEVWARHWAT